MSEERTLQAPEFEELAPECNGTVNVTTFRHQGSVYTVSTTDIRPYHYAQRHQDYRAGYTGKLGNFETMLFIDQDSNIYPFHDLPGHQGLGVFVRYDTEDEAHDGHQSFVTQVKKALQAKGQ
jgi:hypothetical protein